MVAWHGDEKLEAEMSIQIDDPTTDEAVRCLAALKGKSITETIREAVEKEYERTWQEIPLAERIKAIQERAAAIAQPGGKPADKAFYDWLCGEDELSGPL